jgi:hypothetical protein
MSYADCLYDPTDAALTFRFLDPDTGIPIINTDGKAMKVAVILDTIPEYQFVAVPGTNGVFDGKYPAADISGLAIFVDASTGEQYVTNGGNTYITSIFSYDCDGSLQVGIPGVVPFDFGYLDDDNQLYIQSNLSQYNPATTTVRRMLARRNITKRLIDDATRLYIAETQLKMSKPVAAPSPSYRQDEHAESASRCPNTPIGLVPYADPHRPEQVNGCGSTGISTLVPNLDFEPCCNNHDRCYDNCATQFTQCTNDFQTCNRNQCYARYGSSGFESWACLNLADFYAYAVSGDSGRSAFSSASHDRCSCNCPTGQAACNNACIPVLTDPSNCGACGNVCASGECIQGQCYVEPTAPPASTDPCDPANFYNFQGANNGAPLNWDYDNYVRSGPTADGVPVTKRECCQWCFASVHCIAYLWAVSYTRRDHDETVLECGRYTQNAPAAQFGYPGLSTPDLGVCPMGGTFYGFWNLGHAPNTGGVGDQSTEPGPCARNDEFLIGN